MAAIPIVNAFDRRAGIISAVVAMLALLIAILLMRYEMADPPPVDIPMKLAEPIDQTIIEHVQLDMGGGGAGNPSESPKNNTNQTEQIITQNDAQTTVNAGNGNVTNTHDSDDPPSGDESEDHFSGGNNDGVDGGENGISGQDSGTGTNGNGPGGAGNGSRRIIKDVYSLPDYDHVVRFKFKVTINANGNVISVLNIKGSTTTTDQVLINKVRQAVMKQVKYSKAPGAPAVTKIYDFVLQPK